MLTVPAPPFRTVICPEPVETLKSTSPVTLSVRSKEPSAVGRAPAEFAASKSAARISAARVIPSKDSNLFIFMFFSPRPSKFTCLKVRATRAKGSQSSDHPSVATRAVHSPARLDAPGRISRAIARARFPQSCKSWLREIASAHEYRDTGEFRSGNLLMGESDEIQLLPHAQCARLVGRGQPGSCLRLGSRPGEVCHPVD